MLACPSRPWPLRVVHCNAAKLVAVNALDPVVLGQALIDEGVIRFQQIDDAAILAQRAFDEEFRFLRHRLAQILVEVREGRRIRLIFLRYCARTAIGRRSSSPGPRERGSAIMRRTCASRTDGSPSCPALGNCEQLIVGNAAPQEERQARRQLDVADPVNASGSAHPADRPPHGK